jgi:hypothetical protein
MGINVLLSGRLKLDGYGQGKPEKNGDGSFRLGLPEGSTVQQVIQGMGVPSSKVTMTMLNGCKYEVGARVKPDELSHPRLVFYGSLWRTRCLIR